MLIDLLIVVVVIYSFWHGRKKGFTVQFFQVFKYLLILFSINSVYPIVGRMLKYDLSKNNKYLEIYVITFILLYVIFSILTKLSEKFLKTMKLKSLNEFLGGIFGVLKSTFIIFIIYIFVLIGSGYNQIIKQQRDSSKIIEKITEYGYIYSEILPDFIKTDIVVYRKKMKEEIIKNRLLKEYRENKSEKETKKDENKNH